MPRPRKRRRIRESPPAYFYKPQGVPLGELRGITLPAEGLEALRLVDAKGLSQEEAAALMEVSRPTLCRMLGQARTVVAKALANGWAIRIEGAPEAEPGRPEGLGECRGPGRCRGLASGEEGLENQEES